MSTLIFSPALSSISTIVPPLWMKTSPVPSRRSRMNPSPPKNPAPSRLVNSTLMLISPAAHRNESRWHRIALYFSAIVRILPGYGALNATRPAAPAQRKKVRKRLSPARSFRVRPPRRPPGIRASISMPSVM